MNIFRISFSAVLFLFIITNAAFSGLADKQILPPNEKLNRKSEVFANTAIVLFKENSATIEKYEKSNFRTEAIFSGNSLRVIAPMLKPEQSLTFNSNKKQNALLSAPGRSKQIIEAEKPLLRTFIIEYDAETAPEMFCADLLKNNPEIMYAEPYYVNKMLHTPNDSLASKQTMLRVIKALDAWDSEENRGSPDVIIGISDNGVEQYHEDIYNSIAANENDPLDGIDNDENGYVDDYLGCNITAEVDGSNPSITYNPSSDHGTNVSGIAGATANNIRGMVGTGYNCKIFPIKASIFGEKDASYGYQSIIYAALRGCKVLNCSWGAVKPFSQIDQNVIDFAVAHDVAIVAAGGNYEDFKFEEWFPAGYNGVLGVGETDLNDYVTTGTALGVQVEIMAPGRSIYYPTFKSYSNSGGGTSYSSPVVAGVVGVVRAKYPHLSARQAMELVRVSVDNIEEINMQYSGTLPGRVNMLKACSADPSSVPSIRPVKTEMSFNDGHISERFQKGDTVNLKIFAYNFLGAASNVKFAMAAVRDFTQGIEMLNNVVEIAEINANSDVEISGLKFFITEDNVNQIFLNISIFIDDEYFDYFLLPFTPTTEITTFSNDAIKYSVGDRGTLGFSSYGFGAGESNKDGVGFVYKSFGNQIWKAGLITVLQEGKASSSLFGEGLYQSDYSIVKRYIHPDNNIGVLNDASTSISKKIGLEITQEYITPADSGEIAKVKVSLKNTGSSTLDNLAAGYYIDWDLGTDTDKNRTTLSPEAVPAEYNTANAMAQIAEFTDGGYPFCGTLVYSKESGATAQYAGLDYNIIYDWDGFTEEDQIRALTSGTDWQLNEIGDINIVIGMKFTELLPDEEKSYEMCFGCAESAAALAEKLKNCAMGVAVEDNFEENMRITAVPQPANENLYIEFDMQSRFNFSITDINGKQMYQKSEMSPHSEINIDISRYSSGTYFIVVEYGGRTITRPLVIVK